MSIDFAELMSIPDATDAERASIESRLQTQTPSFKSRPHIMAIFSFGGTIQSGYSPQTEKILPVSKIPAQERISSLAEMYGIANREITGALLVNKDSRDLTKADLIMLVHTIKQVENARILVTCGTYLLPKIALVLDHHFGHMKSNKIIAVTGLVA